MKGQKHYDTAIKSVAERLRAVRIARGLTQEAVYFNTGLNMRRVEGGKTNLSLSTLCELCKFYGITLEELFKGHSNRIKAPRFGALFPFFFNILPLSGPLR